MSACIGKFGGAASFYSNSNSKKNNKTDRINAIDNWTTTKCEHTLVYVNEYDYLLILIRSDQIIT